MPESGVRQQGVRYRSTYSSAAAGRLIFVNNVKTSLYNKYTPGANVGALNASVRRALKRRATSSSGTLTQTGVFTAGSNLPCCPELQSKTD